jgi:uncharacterized protein
MAKFNQKIQTGTTMQFTLEGSNSGYLIDGYEENNITINQRSYETGLCLCNRTIIENWLSPAIEELRAECFKDLLKLEPELIILGTGLDFRLPNIALAAELQLLGVSIESMSTGAACRTYNVLVSERRPVAAALMSTSK